MGLNVYFLILMSLAGGLVAMIADKLGRTLGKKRLTLFGMRPRHTATTITVVSGMIIPLITVGLVSIVSKPVRDWIVEGPKALEQRDELRRENQNLEDKEKKTQARIALLQSQESEAEKKLLAANNAVLRAKKQVAQLTGAVNRYQAQMLVMQRNLTAKQSALATADAKQKTLALQISKLEKSASDLNKKYQATVNAYFEAKKQKDQAEQEYLRVTAENDKLTATNNQLKSDNANSSADLAKTNSQLDQLRPQLEQAKLKLDDANTRLAAIQAEVLRAQTTIRNNVSLPFLTPIIFDIGDELARVRVPAGTKESAARGLLANLMKDSVRVARAAGARATSDAATLFPRPDENGNQVSVAQQEETIVNGITNKNEDLVLIAICELNSYKGGGVPVDVQPFRDPIVYRANDKIAETMINGNDSEESVVQHLSDFLQTAVRPQALKDGMIPIGGSEATLGELSLTDLLKLAHSINATSRPVRVTAIADVETRAGDPLKLRFRVR